MPSRPPTLDAMVGGVVFAMVNLEKHSTTDNFILIPSLKTLGYVSMLSIDCVVHNCAV